MQNRLTAVKDPPTIAIVSANEDTPVQTQNSSTILEWGDSDGDEDNPVLLKIKAEAKAAIEAKHKSISIPAASTNNRLSTTLQSGQGRSSHFKVRRPSNVDSAV